MCLKSIPSEICCCWVSYVTALHWEFARNYHLGNNLESLKKDIQAYRFSYGSECWLHFYLLKLIKTKLFFKQNSVTLRTLYLCVFLFIYYRGKFCVTYFFIEKACRVLPKCYNIHCSGMLIDHLNFTTDMKWSH